MARSRGSGKLKAGQTLVSQGEKGDEVFLLLDGVLRVEHDGERLAEYGPGALLGERAHLEGGKRTSTLVAVTPARVAAVKADQLQRGELHQLAKGHRREQARAKSPRGSRSCAYTSAGCAARPRRRDRTSSATADTRPASRSPAMTKSDRR